MFSLNKILTILLAILITSTIPAQAEEIVEGDTKDIPLFVTVTAKWCTSCQKLKPIVEELEYEYQGKVKFLTLDNSSKQTTQESLEKAENAGIKGFYEQNKTTLPIVGVFCNGKEAADKKFQAETQKALYQTYLDDLLINGTEICSLK